MIPLLPPGNHYRNGFFRVDGDGVHGTIHAAQVTHLTVCRIFDKRLFCPQVLADNICGACSDACPATDAALDGFYGHG